MHWQRRCVAKADAELFVRLCVAQNLPKPEREHCFHATRKWAMDFAWTAQRVGLEVEGAVWVQGRHTRGSGFVKDMEKYNAAAVLGWRILRVEPSKLCTPSTFAMLAEILRQ